MDEGGAAERGERIELRLAGAVREHGLVFAGVVLAEAAVLHEGRFALQSQVYGSDPRGRAGRSDVLLASREIESPHVSKLDALVCLTPESLAAYAGDLRDGALLLCEEGLLPPRGRKAVSLPLVPAEVGDPRLVGLAVVGALCQLRPIVTFRSVEAALADRASADELPRLREALERGKRLAQSVAAS